MARIIICEPSTELRVLFAATMARLGHASAPCTASEPVPAGADAILVDVDEGRGAETVARARALTPDLPVIACSIYPRGERSDALSAVAHLVKPFSRIELERAIADALGARSGTMSGCPPTVSTPTAASA
jgi:CheY-like chemotaxis protein